MENEKKFTTSHELAKILLEMPDEEVTTLQNYTGQYGHVNCVAYAVEQDHSTGDIVTDDDGNEETFIRIF